MSVLKLCTNIYLQWVICPIYCCHYQFPYAVNIKVPVFEDAMSVLVLKFRNLIQQWPPDYVFCAFLGRMPLEGHFTHSPAYLLVSCAKAGTAILRWGMGECSARRLAIGRNRDSK